MILKRSTLLLILMAAAVSIALFVVKYRVQHLDDQLIQLNRQYSESRQAIHVLKSEWAHLNQPDRLRGLAERYLEVGPPDAERVGSANTILDSLPVRKIDPEIDAPHAAAPVVPKHVEQASVEGIQ